MPDRRFHYSNTNYALLALYRKNYRESVSVLHEEKNLRSVMMKDTYVATPADSAVSLRHLMHVALLET